LAYISLLYREQPAAGGSAKREVDTALADFRFLPANWLIAAGGFGRFPE
jgi:hypothetical protein